jgi:tetratricopeptide (TPR) repeat protein
LANSYYLLNDLDNAIVNYKKALELNPQKVEAYYNLGNSYCTKENFNDAIDYYTKAISLDPMHEPAVYNLGYAYHRVGDLQ